MYNHNIGIKKLVYSTNQIFAWGVVEGKDFERQPHTVHELKELWISQAFMDVDAKQNTEYDVDGGHFITPNWTWSVLYAYCLFGPPTI